MRISLAPSGRFRKVLLSIRSGATLRAMKPLAAALSCLLTVPVSAQVIGEAASAGTAGASASAAVAAVPGALTAPAMNPSVAGALLAPAAAPAPGAPVPALAPSLITPIDPAALPSKGKDYTPESWAKLVSDTKDEGSRAVLRSMTADNPSDPQVKVTLKNGESIDGRFRGVAKDKLVFEQSGKLLGLGLGSGDIAAVTRSVDLWFDGATLRPAEVPVFGGPVVVDPFKDLSAHVGRIAEIDTRDLDDLKYSAQTVRGRIVKADGKEILLESANGTTHIQKEFHRIDAISLRTRHFSSYGKIGAIAEVDGHVPLGAPVELVAQGGKKTLGRFRGVRKDADGPYVVIETDESGGSKFRAFRDFYDLRTPGYDEGELTPGSELVYALAK